MTCKNGNSRCYETISGMRILCRDCSEEYTKQEAVIEGLKKQLKEGLHCQSFHMCGDAHDNYEKRIKELEAQILCMKCLRE